MNSTPFRTRQRSAWRLALGILILAGIGFTWAIRGASPLAAQQRPPGGGGADPSAVVEYFRRYGTRHLVPMPSAGNARGTNAIHVISNGWKPTRLLVVELADVATTTGCTTAIPTSRFVKLSCHTLDSRAFLSLSVEARTEHVLLYSLKPASGTDACTSFAAVKSGDKTLEAWEREEWLANLGEPFAATVFASTQNAVTSLAGIVTGVSGQRAGADRPGGQNAQNQMRNQALPLVWAGAGATASFLNSGVNCATVRSRSGALSAGSDCTPLQPRELQVPPLDVADVPVAAVGPVGVNAPGDVVAVASRSDGEGWLSYTANPQPAGDGAGLLAFPLARGSFPNEANELFITNMHVTATAQIDIFMWDGTQKLKFYKDPLPLCAGSTRKYDVNTIAGPVDPAGGERAVELAMRVESSNRELPSAPPIAGLMVMKSDWGVSAYAGMSQFQDFPLIQNVLGRQNGVRMTHLVPNVKLNVGSPPMSTLLVVQPLGNPAQNFMAIDLYDRSGKLVVQGAAVRLGGQGQVGSTFIDLGGNGRQRLAPGDGQSPLPASFEGFAVIQGQDGAGLLGIVAVEVPNRRAAGGTPMPRVTRTPAAVNSTRATRPDVPLSAHQASADTFLSWTGIFVPRWPDPDGPTPTPAPTRDRSTPAPGTGTPARPTPGAGTPTRQAPPSPTVEPTRDEPTPTTESNRDPVARLFLPALWNGGGE